MCKLSSPHDSGDGLQSRSDKAIAGRVDSQLIESACYQAAIQQLMAFASQDIDTAPNTINHGITRTVAKTQPAPLPYLNSMRKNLRNQIRQIVRTVFQADLADITSAKQVRGIEH
nr:hypothetical protein L321_13329 [Pseudomonas plecoglossicida NB2011]